MIKYNIILTILILLSILSISNKCEDSPNDPNDVTAGFTYTANALTVSFTNTSENGTSYTWDFGVDGIATDSSTIENPTYVYPASGTYLVSLQTTGINGSNSTTVEITVISDSTSLPLPVGMDKDLLIQFLTGGTAESGSSKKWILLRDGIAFGFGPEPDNNQNWAFGTNVPLADRPCILDDEYIFSADGTFQNDTKGTVFLDHEEFGGWNDLLGGEQCYLETEMTVFTTSTGNDYSVFANGGDYTFTINSNENTLALSGSGAYIGLPNKTNNGDLGPDGTLPTTRNFQILNIEDGNNIDLITLTLPVNEGVDGYWNFYLVSYSNESDIPKIPIVPPVANFVYFIDESNLLKVDFTNRSERAMSFTWDFGVDGITTDISTEENPSYTYPNQGIYTVTLEVTGNQGEIATTSIILNLDSTATPDNKGNRTLVWSDEFTTTFDESKWDIQVGDGCVFGVCGWGNKEEQSYRRENITVENGNLVITAKRENAPDGKSYTSARIRTVRKQSWTYGWFEARIKLPEAQQGMWPAFWMLPSPTFTWPQDGEIDIMEWIARDENTIHGTIHYSNNGESSGYESQTATYRNGASFAETWHVYAVEWTASELKWYIDGNLFNRIQIADVNGWPFDRPFHLLLNLAVGGEWPGFTDASTQLPQRYEVDYVRVYQKDGESASDF